MSNVTLTSGYLKNAAGVAKPGDTVIIPATMASLYLNGLKGTKDAPITIKSSGIVAGNDSRPALIELFDCAYLILDGILVSGLIPGTSNRRAVDAFGFKIQASQFISLINCAADNTITGLKCKNDVNPNNPLTFYDPITKQGIIEGLYVKNFTTSKSNNEGIYVGSTVAVENGKPTSPIVGARFENILVTDAGWDGFQVSGAIDLYIDGVVVNNTGTAYDTNKDLPQYAGICIQDGCYGTIKNLAIKNTATQGLIDFSAGKTTFESVYIENAGLKGTNAAIFIDNRPDRGLGGGPKETVYKDVKIKGGPNNAKSPVTILNGIQNGAVVAKSISMDLAYDKTAWAGKNVVAAANQVTVSDLVSVPPPEQSGTTTTLPEQTTTTTTIPEPPVTTTVPPPARKVVVEIVKRIYDDGEKDETITVFK